MKVKFTTYKLTDNRRVSLGKFPGKGYVVRFKILTKKPNPRAISRHIKGKIMVTDIVLSEDALCCIADYVLANRLDLEETTDKCLKSE